MTERPHTGTTPRGPPGLLLYVVGDVHGRADLLGELLEQIREDAARSKYHGRPVVAFLGDYIDRGPDPRGVIDLILALEAERTFGVGLLRGNHDQFLLDFLEDGRSGDAWMDFGGATTLASYGVTPPKFRTDIQGWLRASADLSRRMPWAHRDLLERSIFIAEFGDYVLVHAGVRPGVALDDQDEDDLTGIRKAFLDHPEPIPGYTVVFGHTPFEQPVQGGGKIGIDTGAYATGILTALRLFEDRQTLLQTQPNLVVPLRSRRGGEA